MNYLYQDQEIFLNSEKNDNEDYYRTDNENKFLEEIKKIIEK